MVNKWSKRVFICYLVRNPNNNQKTLEIPSKLSITLFKPAIQQYLKVEKYFVFKI